MGSKIGGGLGFIGGIAVILSVPFALFSMVELVSAEVGYTVTLGEIWSALRSEFPTLYITILVGILANLFLGCLLLGFGGTSVAGKGTSTIATLAIVAGILSIVFSIAIMGGIVGIIGGLLGIVGGALSRKKKEQEVIPSPPPPPT